MELGVIGLVLRCLIVWCVRVGCSYYCVCRLIVLFVKYFVVFIGLYETRLGWYGWFSCGLVLCLYFVFVTCWRVFLVVVVWLMCLLWLLACWLFGVFW